ncbi:hypothetical protein [Saccharopolyspora sp. NPDC002376]
MSGYLQPRRGDWVTFHRDPVYTPACHRACRKPGGHQGYAGVGQVECPHPECVHGRPAYRVRHWHPDRTGELEALTAVVAADRLIAITRRPRAMPVLLGAEPPTGWEALAA